MGTLLDIEIYPSGKSIKFIEQLAKPNPFEQNDNHPSVDHQDFFCSYNWWLTSLTKFRWSRTPQYRESSGMIGTQKAMWFKASTIWA